MPTRLLVALAGCALAVLLNTGSAIGQPSTTPSAPVSTPPPGSGGTGDEVVQTQWGPLGPADRDFMNRVKQAGLWEKPAGEKGKAKRADQPKIQEACKHLIEGHTLLDNVVNRAGVLLGHTLPTEATDEQKGWLAEMDAANGEDFDAVFANRLRAAHGKVYAYAAQIRAGTKNELIRILSTQAMITVFDHMKVLEDTGRVDFAGLESPQPLAPPTAASGTPEPTGDSTEASTNPTDGVVPTVPEGTKFTRTAEQGVFGDNNGVFFGAIAVLALALVGMRMISRSKKKSRRSSRSY
jgi:predicted outer membrane protein